MLSISELVRRQEIRRMEAAAELRYLRDICEHPEVARRIAKSVPRPEKPDDQWVQRQVVKRKAAKRALRAHPDLYH